jgi:hypothetical protein
MDLGLDGWRGPRTRHFVRHAAEMLQHGQPPTRGARLRTDRGAHMLLLEFPRS